MDPIELIEASYRTDLPEDEWLAGITNSAGKLLDRGLGGAAYTYQGRGQPTILKLKMFGDFQAEWLLRYRLRMGQLPKITGLAPPQWDRWMHQSAGTARTTDNLEELIAALEEFGGARDVLGINGRDPQGFGIFIGVPQKRALALSPAKRELLTRVSAHLASGFRIRRALAGAPASSDRADAVLTPSGALLHGEGEAKMKAAREQIRDAVLAIERARTREGRRNPERATRAWKGLVDSRWTLLDCFENDGKRFVLAARNDVPLNEPAPLSRRERQVLAYAAMDHSNKEIAYELGLSAATVRVLVARAARKLGAKGRADAIIRFRAFDKPSC